MKEPLYFHIIPKDQPVSINMPDGTVEHGFLTDTFRPHTYAITNEGNKFYVGYTVVHKKDQFNKEFGRMKSKARMDGAIQKNDVVFPSKKDDRIHDHVRISLENVIKRSKQIRRIEGPVDVIINCSWLGRPSYTKIKM